MSEFFAVPECSECGKPFPGHTHCPECGQKLDSRGKRLAGLAFMLVVGAIVVGAMIAVDVFKAP